ncbi:MAG TPA: spore germination protein GerW family protein [bacterium]|jgi:uncharacterized spore protein YtfJ
MANSGATEILDALMRNMRDIISTKTVVGEPIQNGSTTILPVMKVALGFGAGAGGGEKPGENGAGGGGGGGGGISITPIGFLVVDEKRALLITPKHSRFDWVVESLPELLDKIGHIAQDFRRKPSGEEGQRREGPPYEEPSGRPMP